MAKVIIVLISVPFVLVGAESLFSGGAGQDVAEVNGEELTVQQLEEAVFLEKQQLLSRMGQNVDPAMLEDSRLRKKALDTLVTRTLMLQQADTLGMAVADVELNRMIMQNSDFHDEQGRFSRQRYISLLGSIGMTPAMYKRLFRTDLLRTQYVSGIVDTGFMTDKDLELQSRFLNQTRDIRYLVLSLEKFKQQLDASDDEVKAYYDNNPQAFQSEESVVVNYIELNKQDFAPEISEEDIEAAYQQEIADLETGEQRQVSHILLEYDSSADKEKAAQQLRDIKTRIDGGESFAELAAEYSDDIGSSNQGGSLGALLEDAYPQAFVEAARQLGEGEVSDIIETDAGLHLVRLDQILKTDVPDLEERRDELASELREAKASPLFWAAVEELKDMAFNAMDLQEPANALDVDVRQSGEITRNGGQGVFSDKRLVNAAFSDAVIKEGYNSEVIELSDERVIVMHLERYQPAEVMPFAKVAAKAKDMLMTEKARQAMSEQADSLLAELQQGADVEELASRHGHEWQLLLDASRNMGGSASPVVRHAFTLPAVTGDQFAVDKAALANGNQALMVVSNTEYGSADSLQAAEQQSIRQFIAQGLAAEAFQLLQQHLESEAQIKIY